MGSIMESYPKQRKYTTKHWLLLTLFLLFILLSVIGIYMLSVIKAPLKMDSLQLDSASSRRDAPKKAEEYPPILHQIWLDYMNIPERWQQARQRTISVNPNMTHMLWSSREIEAFLGKEYPWFLDTYKAYGYFNQKVNSARYFIIYHYGGIYMDMDFIVNVSFAEIYKAHQIQQYECAFPATWPSGVSNALFACQKHSKFMKFMTMNLQNSNRWCVVPYATTMWSGGPRFVSKCLGYYPESEKLIFVLPMHYFTDVYFTHLHGSTWHRWDAQLVRIVYSLITSKMFVVILVLSIGAGLYVKRKVSK